MTTLQRTRSSPWYRDRYPTGRCTEPGNQRFSVTPEYIFMAAGVFLVRSVCYLSCGVLLVPHSLSQLGLLNPACVHAEWFVDLPVHVHSGNTAVTCTVRRFRPLFFPAPDSADSTVMLRDIRRYTDLCSSSSPFFRNALDFFSWLMHFGSARNMGSRLSSSGTDR